MAREMGMSQTAVTRIWRAFGLQPHRQETFKLSTDPLFVEKVRDIVGLYLEPPVRAMVLCVDESAATNVRWRTFRGNDRLSGMAIGRTTPQNLSVAQRSILSGSHAPFQRNRPSKKRAPDKKRSSCNGNLSRQRSLDLV